MCGICGFMGPGGHAELRRMRALLRHRGPDAQGEFHAPEHNLFFGHQRLSILDLTGGAQPMHSADARTTIVFNGEIYNHLELRQQLADLGHVFRTRNSDTETLLHGYQQWGAAVVERLNGMWAFAILDRARSLLFCSRDRFGKKPFYYAASPKFFAFASELKALAAYPLVDATPDKRALQKYFAYGFIPAPLSFYRGARKLPAGANLTLRLPDLTPRIQQYWEFELAPEDWDHANHEQELCERIREALERAVRRRLLSDVPLGVFLSGGMDSSSVTAFAAQALPEVWTFSVGFEEAGFDERPYARSVAAQYRTRHEEVVLRPEDSMDILPEIMARLDEPMGDSSLLPTFLLCRETRRHVTVALGGDGGDELFAGYDPFRALRLAELYAKIVPKPLHRAMLLAVAALPVSHVNMSLDFRLKRTLRGLSFPKHLWNSVWLGPLSPRELAELFEEPVDLDDVYSEAIDAWDRCTQGNLVDKTLQFYTNLYLQDDILVKADRASMFNSLEVRSPYLDIDLVNLARTIPSRLKYRRGVTKYILKKALEPLLPREILYRPKKGFGVPIGKWFKDGVLGLTDDWGAPGLNAGYVRRALAEHRAGRHDHRALLWCAWLLQNMPGATPNSEGNHA